MCTQGDTHEIGPYSTMCLKSRNSPVPGVVDQLRRTEVQSRRKRESARPTCINIGKY